MAAACRDHIGGVLGGPASRRGGRYADMCALSCVACLGGTHTPPHAQGGMQHDAGGITCSWCAAACGADRPSLPTNQPPASPLA